MERHAWEFVRLFGFRHGVPGFVTIRDVLGRLDFEALNQQFQAWLGQHTHQPHTPRQADGPQEAYSLDGKSLKSTLKDYPESYQDFVAMVHVFSHQSNLVVGLEAFHNGKQGEAQVVRELIEKLNLKGAILTMDALHCQKKR